jgi:hypothetical protein
MATGPHPAPQTGKPQKHSGAGVAGDWPPSIGIDPYYSDDYTVIYNADCRDVLPLLPKVDLVLTDPGSTTRHIRLDGGAWAARGVKHGTCPALT